MAIYKPSQCVPYSGAIDLTKITSSAPFCLECKVDTSNRKVDGYSITLYNENGDRIFPKNDPPEPINTDIISAIENLRQCKYTKSQGNDYDDIFPGIQDDISGDTYKLLNSGENGSYLKIPFIVTNKDDSTKYDNPMYEDSTTLQTNMISTSELYPTDDDGYHISNGNTYTWVLTLYQLEEDNDELIIPVQSKNFDMEVTEGVVLGTTKDRIQAVKTNELISDKYIQLINVPGLTVEGLNYHTAGDSKVHPDFKHWEYGTGTINNVGPRVPIKNYDMTYGYIYPDTSGDAITEKMVVDPDPSRNTNGNTERSTANAFQIFDRSNNPEDLRDIDMVDAFPYAAIPAGIDTSYKSDGETVLIEKYTISNEQLEKDGGNYYPFDVYYSDGSSYRELNEIGLHQRGNNSIVDGVCEFAIGTSGYNSFGCFYEDNNGNYVFEYYTYCTDISGYRICRGKLNNVDNRITSAPLVCGQQVFFSTTSDIRYFNLSNSLMNYGTYAPDKNGEISTSRYKTINNLTGAGGVSSCSSADLYLSTLNGDPVIVYNFDGVIFVDENIKINPNTDDHTSNRIEFINASQGGDNYLLTANNCVYYIFISSSRVVDKTQKMVNYISSGACEAKLIATRDDRSTKLYHIRQQNGSPIITGTGETFQFTKNVKFSNFNNDIVYAYSTEDNIVYGVKYNVNPQDTEIVYTNTFGELNSIQGVIVSGNKVYIYGERNGANYSEKRIFVYVCDLTLKTYSNISNANIRDTMVVSNAPFGTNFVICNNNIFIKTKLANERYNVIISTTNEEGKSTEWKALPADKRNNPGFKGQERIILNHQWTDKDNPSIDISHLTNIDGFGVLAPNDSSRNPYNGIWYPKFESKASGDYTEVTVIWIRCTDADTWGELRTKVVYVKNDSANYSANGQYLGTNVQMQEPERDLLPSYIDNQDREIKINSTGLNFGPEIPQYIFNDLYDFSGIAGDTDGKFSDFYNGNEARQKFYRQTGILHYNKSLKGTDDNNNFGLMFIRPFIGIENGMRLISKDPNVNILDNPVYYDINYIDNEKHNSLWYTEYEKWGSGNNAHQNPKITSANKWQYPDTTTDVSDKFKPDDSRYKICSFYKQSDEQVFDFCKEPTISIKYYTNDPKTPVASPYSAIASGSWKDLVPISPTPNYCDVPPLTNIVLEATVDQENGVGWSSYQWKLEYFGVTWMTSSLHYPLYTSKVSYDRKIVGEISGLMPGQYYELHLLLKMNNGMEIDYMPALLHTGASFKMMILNGSGNDLAYSSFAESYITQNINIHNEDYPLSTYDYSGNHLFDVDNNCEDCCTGITNYLSKGLPNTGYKLLYNPNLYTSGSPYPIPKNYNIYRREVYKSGNNYVGVSSNGIYEPIGFNIKAQDLTGARHVYTTYDYNIRSGCSYEYLFTFDRLETINDTSYLMPAYQTRIITPKWFGWNVCELNKTNKVIADKPVYEVTPGEVWRFKYNLDEGSITHDLGRNQVSSFSKYPVFSNGKSDFASGQVTTLFGRDFYKSNGTGCPEYVGYKEDFIPNEKRTHSSDAISMLDEWNRFCRSNKPKLLRDDKGNAWIVQITSNNTTRNITWNTQPHNISFSWVQIGNPDDIIITTTI